MTAWRKLVVAGLMVLAVGACGHRPADSKVATAGGGQAAAPSSPPAADYGRFRKCLEDAGVDLDAVKDGNGDMAEFTKASESCRRYLPAGGELPTLSPGQTNAMRAYAKCMRTNGVPDFPDPAPPGSQLKVTPPAESAAELQKANTACAHLVSAG